MKVGADFDIAILGAGPAGAAVALALPQIYSVIHIDRAGPEKEKLCSGLLTREAREALKKLTGNAEPPKAVRRSPSVSLLRAVDFDNNYSTAVEVDYMNICRASLDRWLLSQVNRKNYITRWGANVSRIEMTENHFNIKLSEETGVSKITSRYIIDCTGWASVSRMAMRAARAPKRFALQVNLPYNSNIHEFKAFFHREHTDWFGWTVPKEKEMLAGIGFERDIDGINGTGETEKGDGRNRMLLLVKFLKFLASQGFIADEFLPEQMSLREAKDFHKKYKVRGSPITTISSIKELHFGGGGLFTAGEAAGLCSPSSGDGISYALSSGLAIGKTFETIGRRKASKARANMDDYRLYRDLMAAELRELRFNIQKAKMMASPRMRGAALRFLSWHNGKRIDKIAAKT